MSTDQLPATAASGQRQPSVIEQFRRDLDRMQPQFKAALPVHITPEKFQRVVMTAIQNNPSLLKCTRQSLFNACMRAASDGLLPDGREGAIVPFSENEDGQKKSDQASWMPMIAGIRKKARNSGEIADWYCEVVYQGDDFDYQLGDEPHIHHRPGPREENEKITHVYSICRFKDGTLSRDVMTIGQVEKLRKAFSRAKRGPWNNPVTYPEMAKKTVARRHAKSLPMSTDLEAVIRRDDELYDLSSLQKPQPSAIADTKREALPAPVREAPQFQDRPAAASSADDGTIYDADGVVIEDGPAQVEEADQSSLFPDSPSSGEASAPSPASAPQPAPESGAGEGTQDESDLIQAHDRALAAAAKDGSSALEAAWKMIPPQHQKVLRAAKDKRHKPAAMGADQQKEKA